MTARKDKKKPHKRRFRWILWVLLLLLATGIAGGYYAYNILLKSNSARSHDYILLIPREADFDYVATTLKADTVIRDEGSFRMVAGWMKYDQKVRPGRYIIRPGLSNRALVTKLRSGSQDAVKLRFGSHWTMEEVADDIGRQLECGPQPFRDYFLDPEKLKSLGFTRQTLPALLIPNTHEVYWTEQPDKFMERLKKEYDRFWAKAERQAALKELDLTPVEASTLASIVQSESDQTEEWPRISCLYLNRLRSDMMLQADPTVKFAVGDYMLKRILNRHLETDSPYNTYKVFGLPPGPIKNPEPQAIDAVLNPEHHDYLFMCAKADFSGFHNFSKTLSQHNKYAEEYQRALNKLNIR